MFGGDATRGRLESAQIAVKVVPSLTLTSDKRHAPAGSSFAISGTLAPSQPRVQCLLERQVGTRWVTVQRKRGNGWVTVRRAKDSVSKRGAFAGDITRLSRGTFRAFATFEGTGTALPSKSGYSFRSL